MNSYLAFVVMALVMVLTPGPNMAYLMSRSIGQGRAAGMITLAGIAFGLVIYMPRNSERYRRIFASPGDQWVSGRVQVHWLRLDLDCGRVSLAGADGALREVPSTSVKRRV